MAAAPEHQREPCPSRIIDDVGGAFAMGAVGGGCWNAFKLMKNSPNGYRLKGFIDGIRVHAPRVGGSFAGWGACYAVADCTLLGLRGKDDPINSIAAGAFAGGFLQLRQGPRTALNSALMGGFLLAIIEGMGIALQRMAAEANRAAQLAAQQAQQQQAMGAGAAPAMAPPAPSPAPELGLQMGASPSTSGAESSSGEKGGFFGGLFGGWGSGSSAPSSSSSAAPVDLTEDRYATSGSTAAPVNPFK